MSENNTSEADFTPEEIEFVADTDNPSANVTEPATDEDAEGDAPAERDELAEAQIEIVELKDKYLRLYADFENFRRRTSKERLDLIATANADLLKSLLSVVDDFERAQVSFETSTEVAPLKEGIDLVFSKLLKLLESKGLQPMNVKGESFDPDLHESVAQFPAPSEALKGKVIDEVEKGYYLNGKVIRYAKVVVGQ